MKKLFEIAQVEQEQQEQNRWCFQAAVPLPACDAAAQARNGTDKTSHTECHRRLSRTSASIRRLESREPASVSLHLVATATSTSSSHPFSSPVLPILPSPIISPPQPPLPVPRTCRPKSSGQKMTKNKMNFRPSQRSTRTLARLSPSHLGQTPKLQGDRAQGPCRSSKLPPPSKIWSKLSTM
jgi:hypothetical protein